MSLLLGSLVGRTPALAVLTILALCVGVATATAVPGRRLAPLALGLGVPLAGAGLSLDGPAVGAEAAALLVSGSVYDSATRRARYGRRLRDRGAAATAGSRWYVLPFFSTLLVLSLLLVHDDEPSAHWFVERVGETLVGVALAMGTAWLVPRVAARLAARSTARSAARQQQSHD